MIVEIIFPRSHMELAEQVDVFRDMVDKEKVTIPRRSPKLLPFPLYTKRMKKCLGKNR